MWSVDVDDGSLATPVNIAESLAVLRSRVGSEANNDNQTQRKSVAASPDFLTDWNYYRTLFVPTQDAAVVQVKDGLVTDFSSSFLSVNL